MSVIAFSPNVGPIRFDCVISEDHVSEIEITGNPIETGAEVNDHAYVKPKQVTLDVADNNAALIYNALVRFQETRIPFFMITGLTLYKNMLIQSIDAKRDKTTSRILRATIVLREVIIVSTGTAPAGSSGSGTQSRAGGSNSRGARTPSREASTNPVTADRAGGTVSRGDTPSVSVPPAQNRSILSRVFSSSESSTPQINGVGPQ